MKAPSFKAVSQRGFTFHEALHWYDKKSGGVVGDSAATLSMAANTNVPGWMLTVVNPEVISIMTSPQNTTAIFPERRVGDWTMDSFTIPKEEMAGDVDTYSDFSHTGSADSNAGYASGFSFLYQTTVKYGAREQAVTAAVGLDAAASKQRAAAHVLKFAENKFYAYGVQGLPIYGILNHPDSLPSTAPTPWTPPGGSSPVTRWKDKDGQAIYDDIKKLFALMVKRGKGLINSTLPIKLVLSPEAEVMLGTMTRANDNLVQQPVMESLKAYFTNLEVVTLPELSTESDDDPQTILMVINEIMGQKTGELIFCEKVRSFAPKTEHTVTEQKWMAGVLGFFPWQAWAMGKMEGI